MSEQHEPVQVFLSYAHEDEPLLREFEKHLSSLKREGSISTWYDSQIVPGTNRAKEIDRHLEQASIILLLVSVDFLDSDYYYQIEMARAMARHESGEARVIPIIIRSCDWSHTPLANLQSLPRNRPPITTWSNHDLAWNDVIAGIRSTIEDLHQRNIPSLPRQGTASGIRSEPRKRLTRFATNSKLTIIIAVVSLIFALILGVTLLPFLLLHNDRPTITHAGTTLQTSSPSRTLTTTSIPIQGTMPQTPSHTSIPIQGTMPQASSPSPTPKHVYTFEDENSLQGWSFVDDQPSDKQSSLQQVSGQGFNSQGSLQVNTTIWGSQRSDEYTYTAIRAFFPHENDIGRTVSCYLYFPETLPTGVYFQLFDISDKQDSDSYEYGKDKFNPEQLKTWVKISMVIGDSENEKDLQFDPTHVNYMGVIIKGNDDLNTSPIPVQVLLDNCTIV